MNPDGLIKQVLDVFGNFSEVPPISRLLRPSRLPEVAEFAALLIKEKRIDNQFIENYYSAVPFFSAEGMLSTISAFLIYAIRNPDSEVHDQMASALRWLADDQSFVSLLTAEQKRVLANVSAHLATQFPSETNYRKKLEESAMLFKKALG